MTDWLKLTQEDIEETRRVARVSPIQPDAITIERHDIPSESPSSPRYTARTIVITEADLAPVSPVPAAEPDVDALETFMFGLVNAARQENLPSWLRNSKLKWNQHLAAVARGHSTDMLNRNYISHESLEEIKVASRLEQYGLRFFACGENIGVVYGAAASKRNAVVDIQNAFMNQPRSLRNHRGNILNPIWTHVGIGVAYDHHGTLIVTQNYVSSPGNQLAPA